MNLEVIRIGTSIENKTQILGASIFSDEDGLVWHMVIQKESFSDVLVTKLNAINDIPALENMIQGMNGSGNEHTLSQESIPCFGEVEELINFIADEILVDWQGDKAEQYPEILVFSNVHDNQPVVRKITTDIVDGQEVLWITVSPYNP